jgi:hypothetical protein
MEVMSCQDVLLRICHKNHTILSVNSPTIQLFKSLLPSLQDPYLVTYSQCILHFANSNLQLLIDSGILKELMDQSDSSDHHLSCFLCLLKSTMENMATSLHLFEYLKGFGLFPFLIEALVDSGRCSQNSNLELQLKEVIVKLMEYDEMSLASMVFSNDLATRLLQKVLDNISSEE